MLDTEALNGATNLLRHARGVLLRNVEERNDQLFTAVARSEIERAFRESIDDRCDFLKRFVAGLMSVSIVVFLEMIDVDQQHRERPTVTQGLLPRAVQMLVECAPILQAREPV